MKLYNPFTFYADDVGWFLSTCMIITIAISLMSLLALLIFVTAKLQWWLVVPVVTVAVGRTLYAVFTGR